MPTRRAALVSAAAMAGCAALPERPRMPPIVIAHRGASGERPEHTLAAYELAVAQGAHFIEPDLVPTRDGVLVCRHDAELGATTDVAARPEFALRRTIKPLDGRSVEGWFVEDFTLAELRTLRARERLPELRPASAAFDRRFPIATFAEVLRLAAEVWRGRGYPVGVYPELKHPARFAALGLEMESPLLRTLADHGFDRPDSPVFIQCFDPAPLRRLRLRTAAKLTQLVAYGSGAPPDPAALRAIAAYADAIGPEKTLVIPWDAQGRARTPTTLVADAHAADLLVHPWTFRAENAFLPADLRLGEAPAAHGDLTGELARMFALGVDGVFTDHPALALPVAAAAAAPR